MGQLWLEYQEIDSGVVDIQELILNGPLQIQLILNHALRTSLGLEVTPRASWATPGPRSVVTQTYTDIPFVPLAPFDATAVPLWTNGDHTDHSFGHKEEQNRAAGTVTPKLIPINRTAVCQIHSSPPLALFASCSGFDAVTSNMSNQANQHLETWLMTVQVHLAI